MIPSSGNIFYEFKILVGVWFGSLFIPWKLEELRQSFFVLTLEALWGA